MKNFACLFSTIIALVFAFSSCQEQAGNTEPETPHQPTYKIEPPLADAVPESEFFSISMVEDTVLISEHGSFISVPANCFVNQAGDTVENAEIEFVEYSNTTDILLSGIPMEYEEDGEINTFKSAGMCNIQASSDGEELNIASNKSIAIGLRNTAEGDDYNLYNFDEDEGEWTELQKNVPVAETPAPIKPIARETADTNRIVQINIQNANMRPTYRVWDKSEFYLKEGVVPQFNDKAIFWYDMSVIQTADPDEYVLKFLGVRFGEQCVEALVVQPMIDSANFDAEMMAFQERMRTYADHLLANDRRIVADSLAGVKILQRIDQEGPYVEEVETGREIIARIQREERERFVRDSTIVADQELANRIKTDVMRTFTVNKLGVYNCDSYFLPLVQKKLRVNFVSNENPLKFSYFALCSPDDNAVVKYYPNADHSYNLSLGIKDYYVIGIQGKQLYCADINAQSDGGRIAARSITKEEFQKIVGG